MKNNFVPEITSKLRQRSVKLPNVIRNASGIIVLNKRIKSLIFSTDVAIIQNSNPDAVLAVYPFTPTLTITQALMSSSFTPLFVGVGGGLTSGERSLTLALQAELLGAYGVVVNAPITNENLELISSSLDIPVVATVISENDDFEGKAKAGADIFNISGGKDTVKIVKKVRSILGDKFPIIATGGKSEELIQETIDAGANAITFTPPTSGEIFAQVMTKYRKEH
ncbi:hydrolase [Miniphocaeibacter massiliensis]|uniref:hydrolase n=1 Tax=Miniphocaeibacter massiliensis TaxID=2041841 RepID=UPI000C1C5780|nr:hydrolase [Miniphocaeibacter massiliensis]